jgi:hypothetical protein
LRALADDAEVYAHSGDRDALAAALHAGALIESKR